MACVRFLGNPSIMYELFSSSNLIICSRSKSITNSSSTKRQFSKLFLIFSEFSLFFEISRSNKCDIFRQLNPRELASSKLTFLSPAPEKPVIKIFFVVYYIIIIN